MLLQGLHLSQIPVGRDHLGLCPECSPLPQGSQSNVTHSGVFCFRFSVYSFSNYLLSTTMCLVLHLVLSLLQRMRWHACSQAPRTESLAPTHHSWCILRTWSSSWPALGLALKRAQWVAVDAHRHVHPLCCVLIFWMLTFFFAGSSLIITILVKVSLCDFMKSIKQTFNFVVLTELRKWMELTSFPLALLHALVSLKAVSLKGRG